jgi:hypothetical protein
MKKVALVIGNGDYQHTAKLKNPINDSRDIKSSLEKLGFEVVYGENLTKKEMNKKLSEFGKIASFAKTTIFYYAGHGLQERGENYLIPVDAEIRKSADISEESFSFLRVEKEFGDLGNISNIFILDACRDNPFEEQLKNYAKGRNLPFESGRGLANPNMFIGNSIIAYSTSPNNISLDNPNEENGVYAKYLKNAILETGISIETVFKNVARFVKSETKNAQQPWVHSNSDRDIFLNGEKKEKIVEVEKIVYRDREIPVYIEKEKEFSFEEIPVVSKRFEKLDKKFLVFGSILTIVALSLGYSEYSERELKAQLERERKSRMFLNIPQSFSRNGEVVTDNISRLKWEDSSHTKRELNFSEAENYCENLELGGITDWRVPTNKELLYLADRSKHNPALNSIFQNFVSINSLWKGFYWSNQAVTYSGRENENWILNSYNGNDFLEKRTENGYVRCVSGNSHYEDIQFERDNSKEIVKDLTHNLMWVDGGETVKKSWSEAISYCKNLNYGGYSDWRLPTIEELYSITDQRKSSAPFVNSEFNNIKSGFSDWYWSSTEYNGNKSYSWKLNFYNGYDNYYNRSNSSCVRCLR